MNALSRLTWFAFFVCATRLWAQDPVLQLERRDSIEENTWTGRTMLSFRVTVLHPAMRKGASDADFVLDPPGGWRGAIRLVVTDATGKPVEWPFENMGKDLDQPLHLHRLGTASASFLFEPTARGAEFPVGRYQVRARLTSTTGPWRGSVDSPPVFVDLVARVQPTLEFTGLGEGPLFRGWPILLGVKVIAPAGFDGALALPSDQREWSKAIRLALTDNAGTPVALPIEQLPLGRDERGPSHLRELESRTIWFRVAGEATRSLGQGPYRWVAEFTAPASSDRAQNAWSGSVSTKSAPSEFANPPEPLPAELARRQTWAQVEELLGEAKVLRDGTEGGYMNDRMIAVRQSAVPLLKAEQLALQWHDAHPDDAGGAVLVASVMAAQEDKDRAVIYALRAMNADQRQRSSGNEPDAEPSLELRLLARGFEAMPDERHAVLTPALRTALKEVRAGKMPAATNLPAPSPAAASSSLPASAAPPTATTAPAANVDPVSQAVLAPTGGPARVGEPSPGKVVPSTELDDAKIRADTIGQWATGAVAGSQYDRAQYSAAQATGAPNINVQGNSPDAWCPANKTKGTDWLEVTFAEATRAMEVRVRQNDVAGAITKIEAIETDGTVHVWWEGVDPFTPPRVREIVWFAVRVPKTDYLVSRVKITLNLAAMPGWKQIDAVHLVSADN